MTADLFAGIPISNFASALDWYERLFGVAPSFRPNDAEAVWEVAEHCYVFIEYRPAHAGHSRHLLFVDDLDVRVADIASRGVAMAHHETLSNAVRKIVFRDPDGNQFEFGAAPD
jgi:catechol 2,3-dioxygenase-like lactoylglutathione lyase family enzyme